MTPAVVVSNSSPLIALERSGRLSLFTTMVGKIWVPPAVRYEVFGSEPLPEWVVERALTQHLAPRMTAMHLGPGEREAMREQGFHTSERLLSGVLEAAGECGVADGD